MTRRRATCVQLLNKSKSIILKWKVVFNMSLLDIAIIYTRPKKYFDK